MARGGLNVRDDFLTHRFAIPKERKRHSPPRNTTLFFLSWKLAGNRRVLLSLLWGGMNKTPSVLVAWLRKQIAVRSILAKLSLRV